MPVPAHADALCVLYYNKRNLICYNEKKICYNETEICYNDMKLCYNETDFSSKRDGYANYSLYLRNQSTA